MPQNFTHIVRNRSSRGGVKPRLIVLHTTEGHNYPGVGDLQSLANWFDNPSSSASAHLGIDAEGNCVRMVNDADKAWTQVNFNSVGLSIEQVGFASTSRHDWIKGYTHGLYRTALALAYWSIHHNIPLSHSTYRGVCQHSHLGAGGGGHHDCGPGYPERYVIWWARLLRWRLRGNPRNGRLKARAYKAAILRIQKRASVARPSTTH